MGNIDTFKIFQILMLAYNCRSFELFSTRNSKAKCPDEIMIDFYIDKSALVNLRRLHKQIGNHIFVATNYFLIVQEGVITLTVQFNNPDKIFKANTNFCLN